MKKAKDKRQKAKVKIWLLSFCVLGFICFANNAQPQSGGDFTITQSIIAGGGGQNSAGGNFSLDGTIGQSIAGDVLSGNSFSVTSGFWNFTSAINAGFGIEGDVSPRLPVSDGDGAILSNDVVQIQRFSINLDRPFQSNEVQRADSAPLADFGDGQILSNDVIQAQRFQIGLDTAQSAKGPTSLVGGFAPPSVKTAATDAEQINSPTAPPRKLLVENVSTVSGQTSVFVNIRVDAVGDEAAYGFNITYDSANFSGATTSIGTAGGSRLCNATVVGQVNCSVNNFPDDQPGSSTDQIGEINAGDGQLLLKITLTIRATATGGATPINFVLINASNDATTLLPIESQNGTVTLPGQPTAANVSVGGRVLTSDGSGLVNATVRLTDQNGATRNVQTSLAGYYRFDAVRAGGSYVVSVISRRYQFAPQVVSVIENLAELKFVAVQ